MLNTAWTMSETAGSDRPVGIVRSPVEGSWESLSSGSQARAPRQLLQFVSSSRQMPCPVATYVAWPAPTETIGNDPDPPGRVSQGSASVTMFVRFGFGSVEVA